MEYPRPLSAQYKEDFAYPTIKDRLPVILTKVVDCVHRMRDAVSEKHGKETTEELKSIVGRLSKLKHQLQTDKPFSPLEDDLSDVEVWNDYLKNSAASQLGEHPRWFVSSWLYTECYFYRRIREAVRLSDKLKDMDPFQEQKENALTSSLPACIGLAKHLKDSMLTNCSQGQLKQLLSEFIQISLWGNKCDLSISAGVENTQKVNAVTSLESLQPRLLCDDTSKIWNTLYPTQGSENTCSNEFVNACNNKRVDIVLDNAGFELFTDFCLADFLVESKLASNICFHGKAMPWFVSDITLEDFQWTLSQLETSENADLRHYGAKWKTYLANGVWEYKAHDFWTLPFDFSAMQIESPELYNWLSSSSLLVFKGDLNYRKLTGDLKWTFDTDFDTALRGFRPAPLCALRTLKCDLAVGITQEQATKAEALEHDWMLTGRWGVVQFSG